MLIELRRLGMEGQEVFSGMVLIISYLSRNGPEVAVYVEKVHIDGNLDAVPLQVFLFKYLIYNDYLSVGYGGYQVLLLRIGGFAVRYAEKPGDEHHEYNHEGAQRNTRPEDGDVPGREENEHGADAPGCKDGSVGIVVYLSPFHILNQIKYQKVNNYYQKSF